MPNRSKTKGDNAEREAAALLKTLTGWPIHRIRAGASRDTGDLYGLPQTCLQVKNRPKDPLRSIREIDAELPDQWTNSGCTFAAGMVRRPGGRWTVVMTPEMFVTLLREATRPEQDSGKVAV